MKGDGRIQIKVQYMCGRMNLDLELLLESRFPNVDIVTDEIVGKPDYIITREMEHGMEPDIYRYERLRAMDDAKVTVSVEPFVPTIKWPDMWSFIFAAYKNDDYLKGVDNALWLDSYQQGKASMTGHMEGVAEKLISMFDDEILSPAFWEMRALVRTAKLYRYHTSLIWEENRTGGRIHRRFCQRRSERPPCGRELR